MERFTAEITTDCTRNRGKQHRVKIASDTIHAWALAESTARLLASEGALGACARFRYDGRVVSIPTVMRQLDRGRCDQTELDWEELPF